MLYVVAAECRLIFTYTSPVTNDYALLLILMQEFSFKSVTTKRQEKYAKLLMCGKSALSFIGMQYRR